MSRNIKSYAQKDENLHIQKESYPYSSKLSSKDALINNKNVILAKEWMASFTEAGNDFKFEVKNITIEQKMVLIKRLKELGIVATEI